MDFLAQKHRISGHIIWYREIRQCAINLCAGQTSFPSCFNSEGIERYTFFCKEFISEKILWQRKYDDPQGADCNCPNKFVFVNIENWESIPMTVLQFAPLIQNVEMCWQIVFTWEKHETRSHTARTHTCWHLTPNDLDPSLHTAPRLTPPLNTAQKQFFMNYLSIAYTKSQY